eukprot:2566235-Rhodomonas_salina.3
MQPDRQRQRRRHKHAVTRHGAGAVQDGAMVQETIRVGADDEGVGVELLRLESATATVARLWKAGGSTPVQVACFGIEELYNGGGAVSARSRHFEEGDVVAVVAVE